MADDNELKTNEPVTTDETDCVKNPVTTSNDSKNENSGKEKSLDDEQQKAIEGIKKKATQLLLLGKRNILIHDFQSAVSELADSCQMFKTIYGEQADEMGDPYFYYGKALFELARNESEVLGDQVQEDKDDEDEDEEAEEDDDEDKEMECEDDSKKENNCEDGKTEEAAKEDSTCDKENAAEENEEVNDLQLSWEYLELAKLIYLRNAEKCNDTAIKLSEVYLLLGENGLESENYQTAIDDMKQALALQQRVLPEEDRRIAETYYHLGVAHSLDTKFDDAITYFKSAITQLERKIASLEARKKAGDKKTEDEEKDAFYTMDGEIESIRSIIKDVEDKISDMNDYRNQMREKALEVMTSGCQKGASTSNGEGSSSSSIPVSDISHLVRKKRKNENEEENNAKKPKQDNGV